jgi:outer membrane cobalamin receptor
MRRFFCLCLLAALALMRLRAQEAEGGVERDTEQDVGQDYPDFGEAEELVVSAAPETTAPIRVVLKDEIDRIAAPDIPTLLEEALDIGITRHGAYGNSSRNILNQSYESYNRYPMPPFSLTAGIRLRI